MGTGIVLPIWQMEGNSTFSVFTSQVEAFICLFFTFLLHRQPG